MTYTLRQKGRYIYIDPVPEGKLKSRLEKELSYEKKNRQFMPNPQWGIVKLYKVKTGKFPIGLLNQVVELIREVDVNLKLENEYHCPQILSGQIEWDNLRPYQIKAIQLYIANCYKKGGILSMPTGSGKTRVGKTLIKIFNVPTLVIVPTLDLKRQWEERVPKDVTVKTYQSLKSKSYLQQFRFIIFDECHIVAARTLQLIGLNLDEEAITLGLSATPTMRDEDNMKVIGVLGEIVYTIGLRELISNAFLSDAEIHIHSLKSYKNAFMDYRMMYQEYIINNSERNTEICSIAAKSKDVLILVDRIEHGELLLEALQVIDSDVIFLNGQCKDRSDLDHNIIIATSIFDLGIDIPRLETLILAGGGKSTIKTIQRMGRVLRLFKGKDKAIIHDFNDRAKWLDKHSKERRSIFEENFNVIDM